MKYEYCGISLGDDIKDIISKFNISKIKYEKDLKTNETFIIKRDNISIYYESAGLKLFLPSV